MSEFFLEQMRNHLQAHRPRQVTLANAPHRAAVSIIFRPRELAKAQDDAKWQIMFIKRTQKDEDPWSGHIAFPGGHKEAVDKTTLETAIRETREEVGIDLTMDVELLGRLDDVHASARGDLLPLAIEPFVFYLPDAVDGHIVQPQEVEKIIWVNVSQLLDIKSSTTTPFVRDGLQLDLPAYDIGGHIIWGLTYRMLQNLFTVLKWQHKK